jgi:TetR/AcrR family acrAB operon transcriptional repressor
MRDRLLKALREVAQRHPGEAPSTARVAAAAGVDDATVLQFLGPADNFAALLSYHQAVPAPADTRERILQSAARVFASKGLQRATLDEVAADAGMTKGAIYWHFKSKNDLFFALLDHRFNECTSPLTGDLDAASRQALAGDPKAAMASMFKLGLQRCTNDADWPRLYFECVAQTRDPEVRTRLADFYERGWSMSREVTRTLQERGMAPAEADLDISAVFWTALFDGLVLAWMINPDKLDIGHVAEGIFDLLWCGIAPASARGTGAKKDD